MNKKFGIQGEIIHFPFKDLRETIYSDNHMEIEINNGILSVGVDDEATLDEAKEIALLCLAAWNKRQNIKTNIQFNRTWHTDIQGVQNHTINLRDTIPSFHDRLVITTHTASVSGRANIITQEQFDTASFVHDKVMLEKARKYPALKNALFYYNEEIISDERPLYGVYKAIEAITSYLQDTYSLTEKDARKKLAALADQPFSYVDDLIQTTQIKRHHKTSSKRKLDDNECRVRAHILIDAFARSLS